MQLAAREPQQWPLLTSSCSHTLCASPYAGGIQADGSAYCWGSDFSGVGLLGSGSPASSAAPLPLTESGPWDGISAGSGFSCGIKSNDLSAWCW